MKKIFLPTIAAALLLCAMTSFASAPAQAASGAQTPPASDARVTKLSPQIKTHQSPARLARPVPQIMKELSKQSLIVRVSTFQVNEQMPVFKCTAAIVDHKNIYGQIRQITITEAESGTLVQKIKLLPEPYNQLNLDFMKSPAYFMDINFDGNLDLLIPHENSARYINFDAYLWDADSWQFVYEPSFEAVLNFTLDPAHKRIYGRSSGSQITCYTIWTFENGEFVAAHSLVWWPRYLDVDADYANTPEDLMYFGEAHYGTTIKAFCVMEDEFETDPRTKDYFAPGSFWDLHNPRWRSALWQDTKY